MSVRHFVDIDAGTQNRRIFWDREIYEQELEKIFGRCWLFLTHESQIPKPNDYVLTKMGEDEVVVWRQPDGSVKAFLNQCRHRGNRLCMVESGSARALACGYHGWAYNSDGALRQVPIEKQAYSAAFDKAKWGLREVPLVESLHGFVFGCMDAAAPTLREYLGDAAWYFDAWSDAPGGVELLGPPSRSIMRTNWKYPSEGFATDVYHVGLTHASILKVGGRMNVQQIHATPGIGIQVATQNGHGMCVAFGRQYNLLRQLAPELDGYLPDRSAQDIDPAKGKAYENMYLGHWNGTIFPNCSFLLGLNIFKTWHPIGPDKIEVMSWVIADSSLDAEAKRRLKLAAHRAFGTGGVLESEDVDNFEYCTKPNAGFFTRQGTLNGQMGMGNAREDSDYPGVVDELMSEVALRGFYRFYADCMDSPNWEVLGRLSQNWKAQLLAGSAAAPVEVR